MIHIYLQEVDKAIKILKETSVDIYKNDNQLIRELQSERCMQKDSIKLYKCLQEHYNYNKN